MRIKINKAFLILWAAAMLTACSSSGNKIAAPVETRTQSSAPTVTDKPAVAGPGYYTVKQGDTLYRIALEAGQHYKDLVVWNNLANANDIKVGQVLRVMPPSAAQVGVANNAEGIEVTPLTPPAATPTANTEHVSTPRGDKKPYSESALQEMKEGGAHKPESATPPVPPAPAATAPSEPAHAGAVDLENVVWGWPVVGGKVISTFTQASKGIDISGVAGHPVLAAAEGKVMYAGSGIRGYGNLVIIKHTTNLLSAYAHNRTILVKEGQSVTKGQKIAEMGNTDSSEVKLHFEVRKLGKPVDPMPYLPRR